MTEIKRTNVNARLSDMAQYNGVVYLAGQITNDASLDMYGQAKDVLSIIDGLLAQAGTNKSRILMAQIIVANIAEFPEMNRAWDEWVDSKNSPPRATIEARLANPNLKVEIIITAAA